MARGVKHSVSIRGLPRVRRQLGENVYLSHKPPNNYRVDTYGVNGRSVSGVVISRVHVLDLYGDSWIEFCVLSNKLECHQFAWQIPSGETGTGD